MTLKAKARNILEGWTKGKRCTYARVRCEILSDCTRSLEGVLTSMGLRFTRLTDPDPYLLVASGESLYDFGNFLTIIELTDGLSHLFYLLASNRHVSLKEVPGLEFTIAFRLGKREGLHALLDTIGRGGIGGVRHKHRSVLSFLIGIVGSLILSTTVNFGGYLAQLIVMSLLTILMLFILDYPLSVLYFKGVKLAQNEKPSKEILAIRIKRAEKKES